MIMKTTGLFLLLMLTMAANVSAQTNQDWLACRYPVRVFGNRAAVDLTPLFQWWLQQPAASTTATNHDTAADATPDAERPLAAWRRITGTKAGDLPSGWVVNAVIYTSPTIHTNARIILKHPPVTEEQTYYALKARLDAATLQITNDQRSYQADTHAAQRAEDRARAWLRSGSKVANLNASHYTRLAAREHEAATAALNQQQQLEAARPLVQKQFDDIPAVNGQYYIDWFALASGQTKAGVLIYDLGMVVTNAP